MSDRQQGIPILLADSKSRGTRLIQIPFGSPPFCEDRLQILLAEHPELIPVEEIEPAFNPLVFVGREVETGSGPLDLLYVSPSGYLTLVETKLWENPEARRTAVAQIIDYAAGLSRLSFDELNTATRRSLDSSGAARGQDLLDVMKNAEGDFDEVSFIDHVSRNLARGYFLLLIVGNGIREGAERMADYLQKSPGLHFSLALVELALYRTDPEKEFPLYVQPRTIARSVELVRAVVDIKVPGDFEVGVTIPTKKEEEAGRTRRKLTEEIFYDQLAENTSTERAKQVRLLILKLLEMGAITVWGARSVSIRYPDPGESGYYFTMIVFTTGGSFYLGWLDRLHDPGGYDKSIALRYRNCVAQLVGVAEKENYDLDISPVQKLLDQKDDFINCVRDFINSLNSAGRPLDR